MTKHRLILSRLAVILFFLGAFFSRCASVMTPDGGPKDTLPPVIVRLQPDNFTTSFTGKKIYIEFNEFVQLQNQNKEMFTSPAMKKQPLLSIRGKGIVVTIKDTLKENTTYAIDFGSAIKDNNEGNPLHAMRYVFSTGDRIDSMMCSGYTADSYRADSVSRAFIWFFIADSLPSTPDYDSTIFNRKPDVIARSQNNGIFIAQNLKPVNYRIYAFGDKNDNQMYEPGIDLIGRLDTVYNPATMPDFAIWFDSLRMYPSAEPQLYFRMFTDEAFRGQRLVETTRPDCKKLLMYFNSANPDIEELHLDSIPSDRILYDPQTRGKDTVALWLNVPAENLPDTIRGEITYFKHDSIRQYVRTTEKIKAAWKHIETKEEEAARKKEEKAREKAEKEGTEYTPPKKENPFKLTCSTQPEVNPERGFDMNLSFPAVKFDSAAVRLTLVNEAAKSETEVPCHFVIDTLNMCSWHINADWKRGTKYHLYFPEGSITDVMGYQNDSTAMDFMTMDPEKYASITLKVKGESGKKYILQQTDTSGKMQKEILNATSGVYRFNYVNPGDIKIRIIEDANGNGRWDAGNIVHRLQPERSEVYMNAEGEDTFVMKVNWEMELELVMSEIFRPMDMHELQKMLDAKEQARLSKLREDLAKKRQEDAKRDKNSGRSTGTGGGMGGFGGAIGGMKGKVSGAIGQSAM